MTDAPSIFQRDYYQRLYEIEEGHWWAMGLRAGMDAVLDPVLSGQTKIDALDMGCGTGLVLEHLHRYDIEGEVIGLDYSDHALLFCQTRKATQLTQASAVEPPFPAQSFDLIVCLDTLQHLSPAGADQIALNAFARLLRPGGWLYVRTNSVLGHRPLRGVDPNLYRRYSKAGLSNMMKEAGLNVEHASYLNCLPSVWGALKEHMSTPDEDDPAIGPRLAIQIPSSALFNKLMYTILRVEAGLIGRLGMSLPFGHSLGVLAQRH